MPCWERVLAIRKPRRTGGSPKKIQLWIRFLRLLRSLRSFGLEKAKAVRRPRERHRMPYK
jgi:hypothetical protein